MPGRLSKGLSMGMGVYKGWSAIVGSGDLISLLKKGKRMRRVEIKGNIVMEPRNKDRKERAQWQNLKVKKVEFYIILLLFTFFNIEVFNSRERIIKYL